MTSAPSRLPPTPHQVYGYTVCLVAVVVALISLSSIVRHVFTLGAPLQGGQWNSVTLTSFEAYKATYRSEGFRGPGPSPARDELSDDELRRQYEALRAARISSNKFEAQKGIVTHGLLLVVAGILFRIHWVWLRRLGRHPEPSP
ncbi:MAG: hypothetical protein ABR543_17455 [Gemmatimonadaceae bacterium]